MNMTFEKFNETINYYSKTTRTTGNNVWNQDEVQHQFMSLISNCNLTKEQLENIENFMVENNASLDMAATKNNSAKEFKEFSKSKGESLQKSKVA